MVDKWVDLGITAALVLLSLALVLAMVGMIGSFGKAAGWW